MRATGDKPQCSACDLYARPRRNHRKLSDAESAAIKRHSGLEERDKKGRPIVRAVLILRREVVRFLDMRPAEWCNTAWPMFMCPWSLRLPRGSAPVLHHGPAFETVSGESHPFDRDPDGALSLAHKCSTVPLRLRGGYFLRCFEHDLPRRLIDPISHKLGATADGLLSGHGSR